VSEDRVLRRIFGPKREEVAGGWGRLHNEELHNLYASPDIIREMKSRRMRWAGHVALGVGGEIMLEWILWKRGGKVRTGCFWLRTGTSGELFNET
jgi:hypothetical protein